MRNRLIASLAVAVTVVAVSALAAFAQSSAKGLSQQAAETGEAIQKFAVERKDEAVAHARKLAADLDAGIRDLETRAGRQAGEAKARSERILEDLKARRAKAAGKLDELAKASKSSWEEAKKGVAAAYRDLATSYDKAVADLKK